MSTQIPVSVRRNFSVKTEKDHWVLTCDVCTKAFKLEKPKKGEKIHGGNILHLLNHAAEHPIAEEAQEEQAVAASDTTTSATPVPAEVVPPMGKVINFPTPPPTLTAIDPSTPDTKPVQHVSIKHTLPSEKAPNCYKVEMVGRNTKVSHFRDITYKDHRVVKKSDNVYTVVLYAANQKHAVMVATRLIDQYRANE